VNILIPRDLNILVATSFILLVFVPNKYTCKYGL
jgi:hypothetical protein